MRARIDISEVEMRTKIRAKYLRAIENEEWDLLPGQVYVKSFLRTYGDFLGLDSRMLIEEFKRRYERPTDTEARPITPLGRERERPRGPLLPPWALIGVVLVALVVVLYIVGSSANKPAPTPPAGVRAKGGHRRAAPAPRTTPAPAPPVPTTAKLELAPTSQVYVCLVDGTGKKLIPGKIFTGGEKIPTETAPKLLLTLGNASVRMRVNGSPVTVPPSSNSIGFLIGPTSYRPLSHAKQPTCV
jgi:helix-turn-helix protein